MITQPLFCTSLHPFIWENWRAGNEKIKTQLMKAPSPFLESATQTGALDTLERTWSDCSYFVWMHQILCIWEGRKWGGLQVAVRAREPEVENKPTTSKHARKTAERFSSQTFAEQFMMEGCDRSCVVHPVCAILHRFWEASSSTGGLHNALLPKL